MTTVLLIWFVVGYAFGSVPFGLLVTKAAGLGDVRSIGSGNIGATNVLRTGSKKSAIATVLLDMLKGTVPAVIAGQLAGENAAIAAGLGAFIGHIYPVWLKFKGGKGVATYFGVLMGLAWPVALVFAVAWLAVAFVSRISSLSALVGSVTAIAGAWFLSSFSVCCLIAVLAALIFFTHRENIGRLASGNESKIKLSKSSEG